MIIDTEQIAVYPSGDSLICIDLWKDKERTHIVLTRKEALYLSLWTDFPMTITDGGAYITFRENWVHYCYVSHNLSDRNRGTAEMKDFTLPWYEAILPGLQSVLDGSLGWTMTPVGMRRLAMKYHSRCRISWRGDVEIALALENWDLLKPHINSLRRIAKNHSNGQINPIYVSLDGWGNRSWERGDPPFERPSWYFSIFDVENDLRILNGGIIWHGGRHGYSVHT